MPVPKPATGTLRDANLALEYTVYAPGDSPLRLTQEVATTTTDDYHFSLSRSGTVLTVWATRKSDGTRLHTIEFDERELLETLVNTSYDLLVSAATAEETP
jgi:hypothetical protein